MWMKMLGKLTECLILRVLTSILPENMMELKTFLQVVREMMDSTTRRPIISSSTIKLNKMLDPCLGEEVVVEVKQFLESTIRTWEVRPIFRTIILISLKREFRICQVKVSTETEAITRFRIAGSQIRLITRFSARKLGRVT